MFFPDGQETSTSSKIIRRVHFLLPSLPCSQPPITSRHVQRRLLSTGSDYENKNDNNNNNNNNSSIETTTTLVTIQNKTLQWLKHVVIGLNLCPFADLSYRQQQIRIQVVPGNNTTDVLEHVLEELFYRRDHAPGTTLVVCPDLFPDQFVEFWNVATFIDTTLIPEYGFVGKVQVAPFHPLFVFEGSNETSSDNYTNRAPYPIFHILREDEVSRAVNQLKDGDAATVWRRNVDLLETLHREFTPDEFATVMTGNYYACSNNKNNKQLEMRVKQILRQFRVQLMASSQTVTKEKTATKNPEEEDAYES